MLIKLSLLVIKHLSKKFSFKFTFKCKVNLINKSCKLYWCINIASKIMLYEQHS